MRSLIPILMLNVCYLAVILIFLVVTARYLMVNTGYGSIPGSYCSLLVVTARSHFWYERKRCEFAVDRK